VGRVIGARKAVLEAFLKADKNVQVLYPHNDQMALGAIQAIKEAGLKRTSSSCRSTP
jgi:ABC-type sugar transport system substrate-binding protein